MSENYGTLQDDDVPDALSGFDKTPQRTPGWWERRKHKVSGSKLANMLFINNPKELAEYRLQVLGDLPRPPLDAEARKRVKFGVDHEIDACATLLHHVPDMKAWDVGFEIGAIDWFGSSPDGMAHWPDRFPANPWGVIEIKCSTKTNRRGDSVPHSGVPAYYMPQLHAEMACMPTEQRCRWAVFVSWSMTKTKIYVVHFDDHYWTMLWDLILDFKAGDIPFEHWVQKRNIVASAGERLARKATLVQVVQSCCVKS